MAAAAAAECVSPELVRSELAAGRAVLPANPVHVSMRPTVVGRAFRTKVNANIGRSTERSGPSEEQRKLRTALDAGADFVMDLSVGEDLASMRLGLTAACPAGVGTVPIYEALSRVGGQPLSLDADLLLAVIREQAEQGVDFMTIHAGLQRRHVPLAMSRRMGIVSRGGAILAEWMMAKRSENPLFVHWDAILAICRRHDVTLSLGDGLRPGCLADASDRAQFAELRTLGKLVQRCRAAGVQVMVEGPGHVPYDQIRMNMQKQQKLCDGAPFYVLGPVVTDVAPGYDHITSAIGATAAAYYGASLLCYVTPAEHLGLPTDEEVKTGVIAHRIAAHAADVARGLPGARDWDDAMSAARACMDWKRQFELAMDGPYAKARYEQTKAEGHGEDHCSMCGKEFCAIRTTRRIRERVADDKAARHHGETP